MSQALQLSLLVTALVGASASDGNSSSNFVPYSATEAYPRCSNTSVEFKNMPSGSVEEIERINRITPCILYDTLPPATGSSAAVLSLVEVSPIGCSSHRDGPPIAVDVINAQNNQGGFEVGFEGSMTSRFRLISVVAGSEADGSDYKSRHAKVLENIVRFYDAVFIVGTCSFASESEKAVAAATQRVVLAQVGPNVYYEDANDPTGETPTNNDHVFGIHLSSYTYTYPMLKQISFQKPGAKVAIMGRQASAFFDTTCREAMDYARSLGLETVMPNGRIVYDHTADDDNDGIKNLADEDFVRPIARQMFESGADVYISCVHYNNGGEANIMVDEWRKLGAQPDAVWFTCSTWGWPKTNPDTGYLFGAGQWHTEMSYGDEFFGSGKELQEVGAQRFGYEPSYDMVASYLIPYTYMRAVQAYLRNEDLVRVEDVLAKFQSDEDLERLRRTLLTLIIPTSIYGAYTHALLLIKRMQYSSDTCAGYAGPIQFDRFRRNNGRFPAGTQILPTGDGSGYSKTFDFKDTCIAPTEVATATSVFPAPTALECVAGSYSSAIDKNRTSCFLCEQCNYCPPNTISGVGATVCTKCSASEFAVPGSATCSTCRAKLSVGICDAKTGRRALTFDWIANHSDVCSLQPPPTTDDTLECFMLPADSTSGVIVAAILIITGILILSTGAVVLLKKNTKIMRYSQPTASLVMIVFFALWVFSLLLLIGERNNTTCLAAIWFPNIFFMLGYSALFGKVWRVWRIMENKSLKLKIIPTSFVAKVMLHLVVPQVIILAIWTASAPPQYVKKEQVRSIGASEYVVYDELCESDSTLFGGLLVLYNVVMIGSGVYMSWVTRQIPDAFAESKQIALALYQGAVVGIVTIMVIALGVSFEVEVVLTSIASAVGALFAVLIIFLPKLAYLNNPDAVLPATAGSTIQTGTTQMTAVAPGSG